MRTDFENLQDGDAVTLYPNASNPLHKKPVTAVFSSGYFFCKGSNPADGPDYYFGDVLAYNDGFVKIPDSASLIRGPNEPTAIRKNGSR